MSAPDENTATFRINRPLYEIKGRAELPGAFTLAQLQSLWGNGKIVARDECRKEGTEQWHYVVSMLPQLEPSWRDRRVPLTTIFIFAIGCIMIIDGFISEDVESHLAEGSAIRQLVNVLTYSAGFILVALSVIIEQLSRRKN